MAQPVAIWWIRRDLRLADNPALQAALSLGGQVLPVFIRTPELLEKPAPRRQAFLFAGLRALDSDLRRLGGRLVVRSGAPHEVLFSLTAETSARAVFAAEDFSPYARRRDAQVAACLPLQLLSGQVIQHPQAVLKPPGFEQPYTVFTAYRRAWQGRLQTANLPGEPERVPFDLPVASEPLPEAEEEGYFRAGEAQAHDRLERFIDSGALFGYAAGRDQMGRDGTSSLSPYLRFGMLSPRQALHAALAALVNTPAQPGQDPAAGARLGIEAWVNELVWRDFYFAILYHFPYVLRTAFSPGLRAIQWRQAPDDLQAWQTGQTGFPVIDAAMRQLEATGWMHNRARMLAASFLVKDLLIDWRLGERWFMRQLVDGDPAANNGGWQWTAGVGTDAAPYFRIFNPVLQGMKFDPTGDYVRRWVPELAGLPDAWIHRPWEMPPEQARRAGLRLGKDYPFPIVDRSQARPRALAAYAASRAAAGKTDYNLPDNTADPE
jgi:deoxyribodipyrimidine photo-lyase